jgi:hypothetical protein
MGGLRPAFQLLATKDFLLAVDKNGRECKRIFPYNSRPFSVVRCPWSVVSSQNPVRRKAQGKIIEFSSQEPVVKRNSIFLIFLLNSKFRLLASYSMLHALCPMPSEIRNSKFEILRLPFIFKE